MTFAAMPSVRDLLERYRGARVFFEPLAGNNGDILIEMGSRLALQQAGIELAATPRDASAVIMNGGFGISDLYGVGVGHLARYGAGMPDMPLVVLPSSVTFADPRVLREALAGRHAPTAFFAREPYSHRTLIDAALDPSVQVGLDHDMAFRLQTSDWLARLRASTAERHCLVVERTDAEATTAASYGRVLVPRSVLEALPNRVRRFLRQLRVRRHRALAARTAFAREARSRLRNGPLAALPLYAADISVREICTFEEFVGCIANAAIVATNRLHVGILAAMLGKPTHLWPVSTPKNTGIYEYSLRAYPQVVLERG